MFLSLAVTLNSLAGALGNYRLFLTKIVGVFLVTFGLLLGKFINIPFLNSTFTLRDNIKDMRAFTLGATFGFTWTPCIGPVLAAILFWVSSKASLMEGLPLLVLFALGLGTPFVLVGLGFDKFWPMLKAANKYSSLLSKVTGIIFIIFGVLLFTDNFLTISSFLLGKLGSFAFVLELSQ